MCPVKKVKHQVDLAAVCYKAVVLFSDGAPIVLLGFFWRLFCCVVLSVVSSFSIISLGRRGLVSLL